MKKATLLFVLTFLFISCKKVGIPVPEGNNYYFENPQPINDSELSSIPNKFQGIYMNADSIRLNIEKNIIFIETENKFRIHKNFQDSLKLEFNLVDGKYISKYKKQIYDYKIIGDSIEMLSNDRDTVFIFSNSQKAKRINGNLVLSEKDSIYWRIKLISFMKNKLIIKQLYSDDDLKRMDSITKIHSKMIDSTSFIISPNRREFNKFFDLKNFGFDQEFYKTSK
jgi:hypothetical protein